MPYRVERGISTRASSDPRSPDYETWVHLHEGEVVADLPAHVRVRELLESGALTETEAAPAPARRRKGKG